MGSEGARFAVFFFFFKKMIQNECVNAVETSRQVSVSDIKLFNEKHSEDKVK